MSDKFDWVNARLKDLPVSLFIAQMILLNQKTSD